MFQVIIVIKVVKVVRVVNVFRKYMVRLLRIRKDEVSSRIRNNIDKVAKKVV